MLKAKIFKAISNEDERNGCKEEREGRGIKVGKGEEGREEREGDDRE